MKFACGRCWDHDCKCTPQELEEYNKQSEINKTKTNQVKVSLTFPEVSPGDIIIKDSKEYYIKDIVDGVAIGDVVTDTSLEAQFDVKISEPYQKLVSNNQNVNSMEKKIYPEIEVNFAIVDKDSLHINFETFGECNNGEVIKISERYIYKNEDPLKLIGLIIDCTNRFHVMCQTYIKERK